MSTFTEELPQRVTQFWRRMANDSSFQYGIDYLRHNPPLGCRVTGTTPVEKFESAVAWNAYQMALNDIEMRLTATKAELPSLDEPSITGTK